MKIELDGFVVVTVGELKTGDCFLWASGVFMKADLRTGAENGRSCVNLRTGIIHRIHPDVSVEVVKLKAVIDKEIA